MRPGVILPEISKRKPNRDSDISDNVPLPLFRRKMNSSKPSS